NVPGPFGADGSSGFTIATLRGGARGRLDGGRRAGAGGSRIRIRMEAERPRFGAARLVDRGDRFRGDAAARIAVRARAWVEDLLAFARRCRLSAARRLERLAESRQCCPALARPDALRAV